MVLPLYLAVTGAELSTLSEITFCCAYMACHFSPCTQGLTNIPEELPEHAMLILNDRTPCCGHSPDLVAAQLASAAARLKCECVLLDFQRPREPESEAMVHQILNILPCLAAVTEEFAKDQNCPVFLSPGPLHMPLREYLAPWANREIWLEAALCQEDIAVTKSGVEFIPQFPPSGLTEGFFDEELCCHYTAKAEAENVTFTLFDTKDSLQKKLELAHSLGVTRAVGLWQELGNR